MRYVIIGNGIAGVQAAMALREREAEAEITLVSEESDHLFSRTALMYVLAGQLRQADIEPYERDLYARMGWRRVRARATGLDLDGHRVLLGGDEPALVYDRLLLACGSRPRPAPWPGAELPGVGHFVTLQDLAWLEQELHLGPGRGGPPPRADAHLSSTQATSPYRPRLAAAVRRGRPARSAVVIGGGLIGIEVVESMLAAGLSPHLLVREEWFWPMAINRAESAWICERLRAHGVQVHLERQVVRLEADAEGLLARVHLDDGGVIEAEVAVVAIGVVPNTDWLADSGLALHASGGIEVGEDLASSAPDVFAAGDCAAVPWVDGQRRPEQLWYTARDQGRVAARAMLGDGARYARGTWYNSAKLMDIEYTTVGFVDFDPAPGAGDPRESWFFEEQGAVRSTTRIVHQGGRVVGFNLLGRRWDHAVLVRWIAERRSLPWVLAHLAQARFDTELVPPLRLPPQAGASLGGR